MMFESSCPVACQPTRPAWAMFMRVTRRMLDVYQSGNARPSSTARSRSPSLTATAIAAARGARLAALKLAETLDLPKRPRTVTFDGNLNAAGGQVTSIAASIGSKVSKGDKLLTLEAMKMQTTIYSPSDGVVDQIHVHVSDSVETKDLLVSFRG